MAIFQDHSDPNLRPAIRRQGVNIPAILHDAALPRRNESADGTYQRALPSPVRADNGNAFIAAYLNADFRQSVHLAITGRQPFDNEHWGFPYTPR